jgi:hypothetical protein
MIERARIGRSCRLHEVRPPRKPFPLRVRENLDRVSDEGISGAHREMIASRGVRLING